jgi:hypothetical protein
MFLALKSHAWAYPMLEVAHILGISLLFGNLILHGGGFGAADVCHSS